MDVVSQEVGRLHGSLSLASQRGRGMRLEMALPARLALEQAMVLRVDGQAFALPVELIELAQPVEPGDIDSSGPVPRVRIRDAMIPLVPARDALGLAQAAAVSCPRVLLIRVDGSPLAVLIDAIEGTRELVIKPLGPLLAGHPLVSGMSLSVTGEVVFSLSPAGLARWLREGARSASTSGRAAGSATTPAEPRRAATILVVDDSISVRKVVARYLRMLGYAVEEVSDGLEALGKIRTTAYDLILTDLEMPRMDGFELVAELSRLTIARTVPVLVASTRSDPETRAQVLGLGAREFLAKPIDSDDLAVRVRALLRPVAAGA
jgi:CheY-like chemotaxis protein